MLVCFPDEKQVLFCGEARLVPFLTAHPDRIYLRADYAVPLELPD